MPDSEASYEPILALAWAWPRSATTDRACWRIRTVYCWRVIASIGTDSMLCIAWSSTPRSVPLPASSTSARSCRLSG